MIDIKNMGMKYPEAEIPVFTDFSMHVDRGEFILLIGRSGCGKTTLLNLLMKEIDGYIGSIVVNGTELSSIDRADVPAYRRKLGVVFQDAKLFGDYSVYDNLELVMSMTGINKNDSENRIRNVLKLMGAEKFYKRYPKELSGGETQRVCMARALLNYPLILLADEPTGNLDPAASEEIFRLMEVIHRQGTTIIMATHDYDTADKINATHRVIDLGNPDN